MKKHYFYIVFVSSGVFSSQNIDRIEDIPINSGLRCWKVDNELNELRKERKHGGDMYMTSKCGEDVTVFLEHPIKHDEYIGTVNIKNKSFCSSSSAPVCVWRVTRRRFCVTFKILKNTFVSKALKRLLTMPHGLRPLRQPPLQAISSKPSLTSAGKPEHKSDQMAL